MKNDSNNPEADLYLKIKNTEFHYIDGKLSMLRKNPDGTKLDGVALTKVETQIVRGFLNNVHEAWLSTKKGD